MNFAAEGLAEKIECIAKTICKDDADPFRYEQAVVIAESQILHGLVRAARITAVRGHGFEKVSLAGSVTRSDPAANNAKHPGENNGEAAEINDAANTDFMETCIAVGDKQAANSIEHAEVECFRRALSELLSLERYGRRASSRRKRALRRFDAIC